MGPTFQKMNYAVIMCVNFTVTKRAGINKTQNIYLLKVLLHVNWTKQKDDFYATLLIPKWLYIALNKNIIVEPC